MKSLKYFSLIFILTVIFLASCQKFVDIAPPTTELVTTSVFSNSESATAAQAGIYTTMFAGESSRMALNLGLLSDELTNYNPSNIQFYTNSMTANSNPGPWTTGNGAYNYIYQANAIIQGMQGNSSIPLAIQAQLTGESKFIRAFWLFYLTNLYGEIPLITTTSYSANANISRSSKDLVFQQIITDLQSADSLMNSNYIDGTDTAITTTDRSRPNKWAASALLARAYLYNKQYKLAESTATAVIGDQPVQGGNSNGLYKLTSLGSVFLNASSEAIWQLGSPGPNFPETPDADIFYLLSAPNQVALSPQLMGSFEPGDLRESTWVQSYQTSDTPIQTYYFPYKYTVYQAPDNTDCVMVLRLAEQYLIRAEARVFDGNMGGALDDLNMLRNRAGLANYSGGTNQNSILSAILHERQVELFTEWGHRWLDLIRTNSADSVMSNPGNVFYYKNKTGETWNDNKLLFAIPESEILKDQNLTQNTGY